MAKVDELIIELRAKTDQFERAMGLSSLTLSSVAKKALIASAAIGASFVAFGKVAIDVAGRLTTLSRQTGVSVETFSALQFGVEDAGGSLEGFADVIFGMQDNIGQLANGTTAAVENFAKLGISFSDLQNLTPEQQFYLIADAVAKLPTEFQRAEAARNVFGRGAKQLIPILNEAKGSLTDYVQAQKDAGNAVTKENAKALDDLGDSINRMALNVRNDGINSLAEFIRYIDMLFAKTDQLEKNTDRIAKITIGLGKETLPAGTRAELEKELADLKAQTKPLQESATPTVAPSAPGRETSGGGSAKGAANQARDLQKALDDLQKAANRDLYISGLSETEKAAAQAKFEIADLAAQYDTKLTPAQQRQAESIINSRAAYEKLNEDQRIAKEAADAAAKSAEELGYAFESAFEDAALNGGKLSDVLGGLERDIAKIFLRETITKPLGGFFKDSLSGGGIGDFFGNLFNFRANGGAVQAGQPYIVGEKRPEVFIPQSSGRIAPSISGMSGGGNVNVTIVNSNGSNVRQSSTKTANGVDLRIMIEEAVAQGVARTGSPINASIKGMLNTSLVRR